MKQPNQIARKKLKLKGEYLEFHDFYSVNKIVIYKNIVTLFQKFKDSTKHELVLKLSANIKGVEWDTELRFKREELNVLMKDVMPYFEEVEDYETCMDIKTLYKELVA